ncbi:MAG: polysaccharide deacetylase family protein [Candidatus Thorarchaeota archaeon]
MPSIIEKMGYESDDKVVITHIDDIAMSHAANLASFECLDFGVAKCGSVISVSGWLMEAANTCKQSSNYDIGVHLTLTSEYNTYRWRPLSTSSLESGLLDTEGYLWKTAQDANSNVNPKSAEIEMKAQIDIALQNGIDVTHIDCHMGTVIFPKFLQSYIKLAREYKIPAFLPRVSKRQLIDYGFENLEGFVKKMMMDLDKENYPLIDHLRAGPLEFIDDKIQYYCDLFNSLKPGLTHMLFHPAKMSSELKALKHTPVERNQDYEAFTSQRLKKHVESLDIHLIGYRELRKFFRETLE